LNPQFIIALAVSGAIGSVTRYLVGVGSVKSFHHDMRPRGKCFDLESVAG
jgi:fluoride ion exporter CrcB/FEX